MVELSDEDLDTAVADLIAEVGITGQRSLIRRVVLAGLGLGLDGARRLDLKIAAAAIEEMRMAFRIFAPYVDVPKVTIFGSARTQDHDPLSRQAEMVARKLADDNGWMVVTGAGPGIMGAASAGAGPDRSLGVSIQLPFEEASNEMVAGSDRLVSMKYFFTRKLMLVKESQGFVCLPGGFGTMDETFELLTLQQTGKMIPVPIVLLDRPGGTFWRGLERFVTEELAGSGMISPGDLDRVLITDSAEEAIAEIGGFWRNYDSLRWIPDRGGSAAPDASDGTDSASEGADSVSGSAADASESVAGAAASVSAAAAQAAADQLVLRLRAEPTDAELAELNERFAHLCLTGRIERTKPLGPERADRDKLDLPRIVLTLRPRAVGELHRLIRALNELPSAPG